MLNVLKSSCAVISSFARALSSKGLPSFQDVGDSLTEEIMRAGTGHYVHLTGQYFDDDAQLIRNIVLKFSDDLAEDVSPQPILDAVLTNHECKVLTDILVDTKECRYLSEGEVDCVGASDWNYGYILYPYFAFFTPNSLVLHQNVENKTLLHVHRRNNSNLDQKLWMKDIESVFVRFSEKPWSEQTLGVRLLRDQMDIVTHHNDFLPQTSSSEEITRSDLGEVMINTEWMVKAAAQLVYVLSCNRNKRHVPLYLPKVVQADNNPFVELRNSLWVDRVSDKLEKTKNDYIP